MSKPKLLTIASAILILVVSFTAAAVNVFRLQSRAEAPGLGDYAFYAGVPAFVAIAAVSAMVITLVIDAQAANSKPDAPPPGSNPPALVDVPKPTPQRPPLVDRQLPPPPVPETRETKRTRIWLIIDELSDALRDDADGSEALFIVRERFHKLQFAPTPKAAEELEQTDETPAPAKKLAA